MMAYGAYRDMAPTLPSIVVPGSANYNSSHPEVGYRRSSAVNIPNIDHREQAPPPLPPPPEPFSPRVEEPRSGKEYTHSFGSNYGSINDERPALKRRDTGSTTDEGYASYSSTERSLPSLPPMSTSFFTSAADSMKRKLDPIRTFDKSPPRSFLTASLSDLGPRKEPRLAPSVDLPIHSRSVASSRQSSFADSPRTSHLPRTPLDHRSPMDFDHSPRTVVSRHNSDDAAMHGTYEYHAAEDMELDESNAPRRMQSEDRYVAAGQKRRAISPAPSEHAYHLAHGQPDAFRRRELGTRASPTPRMATIPHGHPLSSTASTPVSHSTSYLSNLSIPSSATSYDHRSPTGPSPTSASSPYAATTSLNASPRSSISRASLHARVLSGISPRKVTEVKGAGGKSQGFLMCECCPKKPKKFERLEDLQTHAQEKQYECSYCGNRFKNKNEAERHQNSLHVRRHSWSCSALNRYDRAFHDSTIRPGEADTCGYCGDEFARSGRGPGNGVLNGGIVPCHATDADWEERVRHLEEVHKFRECNSSKKFYRADHFRQHLKHSHAGTSGKWTNMLENACLMDEEPPTPR